MTSALRSAPSRPASDSELKSERRATRPCRAMMPSALREDEAAGVLPLAVVATVCSAFNLDTSVTAYDPVPAGHEAERSSDTLPQGKP
jgi:hypothetical protein